MSDLVERLQSHMGKADMGDVLRDCREAADRIEALEFEVEHERYNVEKTAQEAAKRIKALEAALKEAGEMWVRKDNRIEQLGAALRHASGHLADLEYHYHGDREAMWKPIRAALAQSSPPKTQTPPFNPDDWGDPSSPPEASD